jgi:hypothetical protein
MRKGSRIVGLLPSTDYEMALLRAKARVRADRMAVLRAARERQQSLVDQAMCDPLHWLQNYTKTENPHWKEEGLESAYMPFPRKEYYKAVFEVFEHEPVVFVEKSRDMMMSWCCVAYFTHQAMRYPSREIVFQTKKEDDVVELVHYAKILYDQQPQWLKDAHPLPKPVWSQPFLEFDLGRGSVITGIPGGGDQIRSKHPWGVLEDEAAFQPDAGDAYANAVNAGVPKIIVNSSAGPGWFADYVRDTFTLSGGA